MTDIDLVDAGSFFNHSWRETLTFRDLKFPRGTPPSPLSHGALGRIMCFPGHKKIVCDVRARYKISAPSRHVPLEFRLRIKTHKPAPSGDSGKPQVHRLRSGDGVEDRQESFREKMFNRLPDPADMSKDSNMIRQEAVGVINRCQMDVVPPPEKQK